MAEFGYMMLCEQVPPGQLVSDAARAEEAGFFPWAQSELLPALREAYGSS